MPSLWKAHHRLDGEIFRMTKTPHEIIRDIKNGIDYIMNLVVNILVALFDLFFFQTAILIHIKRLKITEPYKSKWKIEIVSDLRS